ncbi:MAG: hypothetical protein H0X16_11710 [Chloroflexi bacterium]|nr:hypothetical protein [Chloroflexota bacterium]HEV8053723.1 hypothetical protein [Candidatus Limnocylindrales bacterium]
MICDQPPGLLERAAGRGSISAITFWLERRRPSAWGLQTSSEIELTAAVRVEQAMVAQQRRCDLFNGL